MTLTPPGSRTGLVLIAETNLAAPALAMDFPGIPQGFRHLQLVVYGRSDQAAVQQEQLDLRMNGDTGSNYIFQTVEGFNSSAVGAASVAQDGMRVGELPAAGALANAFGIVIIDV